MPTAFEIAHADQIAGTLTTVDRMIVHGHLRRFFFGGGMGLLLGLLKVRLRDFGKFAFDVSEQIKHHAQQWAASTSRPFLYQDRVVKGKDDLARQIARRDGIRDGLICVFSTLELASCFAFRGGQVVRSFRKCLHLYFYLIDREFGFMHLRLQTWFPFQIQIYINGREWLARQLDKRGVHYRRYENTFLEIDDMALAQRLCRRFAHRAWVRIFDIFARRINPALPLLLRHGFGSYYWSLDACEIATDVMWRSRSGLLRILGDLFDYALRCFSAQDVMRFLGAKVLRGDTRYQTTLKAQLPHGDASLAARRPEGRRLKHRIRRNWIKLYDKWSVLRVETVINNPRDFRVLRFQTTRRGHRIGRWIPMRKGICNLARYLEVGEAANRRYLDALAEVRPTAHTIVELDTLTRPHRVDGHRIARLNPVSARDAQLFEAVLRGEHTIGGLRNRDLQDLPVQDARPIHRRGKAPLCPHLAPDRKAERPSLTWQCPALPPLPRHQEGASGHECRTALPQARLRHCHGCLNIHAHHASPDALKFRPLTLGT